MFLFCRWQRQCRSSSFFFFLHPSYSFVVRRASLFHRNSNRRRNKRELKRQWSSSPIHFVFSLLFVKRTEQKNDRWTREEKTETQNSVPMRHPWQLSELPFFFFFFFFLEANAIENYRSLSDCSSSSPSPFFSFVVFSLSRPISNLRTLFFSSRQYSATLASLFCLFLRIDTHIIIIIIISARQQTSKRRKSFFLFFFFFSIAFVFTRSFVRIDREKKKIYIKRERKNNSPRWLVESNRSH